MFAKSLTQMCRTTLKRRTLHRQRPRSFLPKLEEFEDRLVPSTILFQDNMENGANGWTLAGSVGKGEGPSILWHQSSNLRANSPTTAWYYGHEYQPGAASGYATGFTVCDPDCTIWDPYCCTTTPTANWGTLTSRPISLAGVTQATLSFAEWTDVLTGVGKDDRTLVEVSTNGSKFQPVFESRDNDATWHTRLVDLSSYAGKSIQVRFHFDTVDAIYGYGNGEGWYVDDVAVFSGPGLTISDVTIAEVNTGPVNANLAVSLNSPGADTITVAYKTFNQTASAGSDYLNTSGTLTFAPGETTKIIAVPIPVDRLGEADQETFLVQLSNPTSAIIADGQGQVSILDDEPRIGPQSAEVTEGDSGTTIVLVPVTLSAAYDETITVQYATADDSALAGSDYQAVNGTLSFAPGQTTQYIAVPIIGDLRDEADRESFYINLSNPSANAVLGWPQNGVAILDNDSLPTVSVNDVTKLEGTGNVTAFTFTLSLSSPSEKPVSVLVTYGGGGPSTFGPDQTWGTYTFAAGQTSLSYTVWVKGDAIKEMGETFTVNLANPTNATIADAQGVGSIIDDDTVPALWINDLSLVEGSRGVTYFVFTVTLSAPIDQEVRVNFTTADGTATAVSDYQATSGTLVFAPGETTKTISVAVFGDNLKEWDEDFFVNLSGAVNATLLDGQGLGRILTDDRK